MADNFEQFGTDTPGMQADRPRSPQEYVDAITRNPWDESVAAALIEEARREPFRIPDRHEHTAFYDRVDPDGFGELLTKMKQAATLEEKYTLLAQEAPLSHDYKRISRMHSEPVRPMTWYEVIQGHVYDVHPARRDNDAFNSPRPSINDALQQTITADTWQTGVDLGSGTGAITSLVAKACDTVVAVDLFDALHEVAKADEEKNGIENITHVTADVTEPLDLPSESADMMVSNGLTAFIPKDKLTGFVQEVARAMERGGSYFEARTSGDLAQAVKDERKDSAKSLLSLLIGKLVLSPGPGQPGVYPHTNREIEDAFRTAGFRIINHHFPRGAIVDEFVRTFPDNFEDIWSSYSDGAYAEAGNRAIQAIVEPGDDQSRRLRMFGKMAQMPGATFIDADGGPRLYSSFSLSGYVDTFISPLTQFASQEVLDPAIQEQAETILNRNIAKVDSILRYMRSPDQDAKDAYHKLVQIEELLKDKAPWRQTAYRLGLIARGYTFR